MKEPSSIQLLINSFTKLPGIGTKTAERLAYCILDMEKEDALSFAQAIEKAKSSIHKCSNCGLYAEDDLCEICKDEQRDHSQCVVVCYPKEALSFEGIADFHGVYHVLGGVLIPSKGQGVENLNLAKLNERIEKEGIKEIIIATSNTSEGELTSLFLKNYLEDKNVTVTKLATGIPMGASLEYADSLTLKQALQGRKPL